MPRNLFRPADGSPPHPIWVREAGLYDRGHEAALITVKQASIWLLQNWAVSLDNCTPSEKFAIERGFADTLEEILTRLEEVRDDRTVHAGGGR